MNVLYRNAALKLCQMQRRCFKTSSGLYTFWERNDKGGYRDDRTFPPISERMREGFKELKKDIALWGREMKDTFESDPILEYRPGEVDVVWQLNTEESLKKWIVTSDSDNKEGYSSCSLSITKDKKGLFTGELSRRVPIDGQIKRAGYCNIRTVRARKSFKRETHLNWTPYNMLVMKIKGDGRNYLLNINTRGTFDNTWNDMYQYVLYTRGGPYWQIARIPFSKFFFSSKGRIQDLQESIPLNKITSFGITAPGIYPGEFSLEIDYIGLEYDPNHTEEFAYETYKVPGYMVAT